MSSFSADWLSLREPFDRRARNPQVRDAVVASLTDRQTVTVVDLACGTGATLRAVAPCLSERQIWRVVDNDLGLLARIDRGPNVQAVALNLVRDLEAALDGPVNLVTTSALLDLVSDDWLARLAVEIAARRLLFYGALTYDGRVMLEPPDPVDATVIAAVNKHQCNDKGFGPALGPTAAVAAISRFKAVGYSVMHGQADWVLGPDDRQIQLELIDNWAAANREMGNAIAALDEWIIRRRDAVSAGRSSMRVGHVDIFARPMQTR